MIKRAMFVFPKSSSYEFKGQLERDYIDTYVKRYTLLCKECSIRIAAFVEDMLAVTLLYGKEEVRWIEVLSNGDRLFVKNSMEDVPALWSTISAVVTREDIIKDAVRKFPVVRCNDVNEFMDSRKSVLQKRLRYTASRILENEELIVHFKTNNGYCNVPESVAGDGRLIITVDLDRGYETCELGKALIDKDLISDVIKTMKVGG